MNEPLVRATAWIRDDCSCRVTGPDGDGCPLSADYTTGLCSHCQGHADALPTAERLEYALIQTGMYVDAYDGGLDSPKVYADAILDTLRGAE